MGIVTTGSSVSGFAFSIIASTLFDSNLGFPWTVRISAFIVLGCIIAGNLLLSDPKEKVAGTITGLELAEPKDAQQEGVAELRANHGSDENTRDSEEKPRTIRQLLRDPAYVAVIISGFLSGLGLLFPMQVIERSLLNLIS
ncbi:MFS general substrate transporter [Paramyrothecium foliicola]|nr:MFS general substrate transporter [Paramyrothecium foliicola]